VQHKLGLNHTARCQATRRESRDAQHELGLNHTARCQATRRESRDAQHELGLNHTTPCQATRRESRDAQHELGLSPMSHRPVPLINQRAWGRPKAIAIAATTPTAPLAAITKYGAKCSAAAPATTMAIP
jgi:hypothetical protein